MTKRRRPSSSEYESQLYASSSAIDSDSDDASFVLKKKGITSKKNEVSVTRKKRVSSLVQAESMIHDSTTQRIYLHPRSRHIITSSSPIRAALLKWFATVHDARGMPWRKKYNPNLGLEARSQRAYEVWVSEIMLQQTQVATVIPYYNRWMENFPTIQHLAAANIDEVNAFWKGLGYYSRASRLLAGAQKVVKEYHGRLPDNAKDMEANIPGIGRYSAGAICSIAYGERVPVLDGNVHRLLSRFLAVHAPPKAKPTQDVLWSAAQALVEIEGNAFKNPVIGIIFTYQAASCEVDALPSVEEANAVHLQYPGDVNQALIELGSTVCKVREPDCQACPLQTWCSAFQQFRGVEERQVLNPEDIEDICNLCEPIGTPVTVNSYPMKSDRKKPREELDIVNVIEWRMKSNPENRYFLMTRRPKGGLLAGLYEFPTEPNVSIDIGPSEQQQLLLNVLSKTLQGVHDASSLVDEKNVKKPQINGFSIMKVQPVGDVVHVFSHIKKTYRTQICVIEGGDKPPDIFDDSPFHKEQMDESERHVVKRSKKQSANGHTKSVIWVPLHQVTDINMGTGVLKVWNLTKKSWEKPKK